VPGLRFVDAASGALGIEWVDGKSVRSLLGSGDEGEEPESEEDEDVAPTEDEDLLAEYGVTKGMSCYLIHHSLDSHFLDCRRIDGYGGH
jgi:TP53 regulating kinase-like protein